VHDAGKARNLSPRGAGALRRQSRFWNSRYREESAFFGERRSRFRSVRTWEGETDFEGGFPIRVLYVLERRRAAVDGRRPRGRLTA